MKLHKAQLSIELTVIVATLLIVLILVMASVQFRSKSKYEEDYLNAKLLAFEISTTINEIMAASEGTTKKIFLPNKIAGSEIPLG